MSDADPMGRANTTDKGLLGEAEVGLTRLRVQESRLWEVLGPLAMFRMKVACIYLRIKWLPFWWQTALKLQLK